MSKSHRKIIRIANIIEEGRMGGPQIRIVRLASYPIAGIETTVLLPRRDSAVLCENLKKEDVRFQTFRLSHITRQPTVALQYVIFSIFEILSIYAYLKKEAFDIVHVSGGAWQYKGLIAGKLARIKVVWHLNDTQLPVPTSGNCCST